MTQQRSRGIQKKSRIVHVFQNCMQNRFHKIAKRTYLLFFSNSLLLICRLELIINYTQDTCTYIYYTCKRQGTTVSSTLQNILGTFSNSSAGQTVRGYNLHPECCMRKMDSILGHRIRSTRSANLSLQFSSMIILEAKQGDLSTAHKILKHHKISLNLDPNCF